jgi:hypothetical protein
MKKKILINVGYDDPTGKFWQDSWIKNSVVEFDSEKQTIHQLVGYLCECTDCVELSYGCKPQTNMYRDTKDKISECVGYIYRGKADIDGKKALFDVWVSIKEVIDFPIDEI